MSLANTLVKTNVRQDKVIALLEKLQGEDRTALTEALQDYELGGFSHADISRALRVEGHDISPEQVRGFRNKLKMGQVTL